MTEKELLNLAESEQTPFYLFDTDVLENRLNHIKQTFGTRVKICYAMKANPMLLNSINEYADFFEVCSPGEFDIFQSLCIQPVKIVYSGVYKDPASTESILKTMAGRGTVTIESAEQLALLDSLSSKNGITTDVLIRITSGDQFGMDKEDALNIIRNRHAYAKLNFVGFQLYSGTQKRNRKAMEKELLLLSGIATDAQKDGFETRVIEYGPGLPVNHFADDSFDEEEMLTGLSELIKNMEYAGTLVLEMGRYIVSGCGNYVTAIRDIKRNAGRGYLITDGGTHHLKYYGQSFGMKLPVFEHIQRSESDGQIEKWDICGALCSVYDVIARDAMLATPAIGDILIFRNCGDYSVTESPVLFLSRDLPAVYSFSKKKGLKLLRRKRSTADINCMEGTSRGTTDKDS